MRLSYAVVAWALSAAALSACADPVTYTLTGTLSGSIGSDSFSRDAASLKLVGNTSNVTALGGGYYTNTVGDATLTLAGLGTFTFTSATYGAIAGTTTVGFYDANTGFGLSIYDPLLTGYALTAPFTDTDSLLASFAAELGATEPTSRGALSITSVDSSTGDFTAAASAATPEPSSLLLLGTGLASICRAWRRRSA